MSKPNLLLLHGALGAKQQLKPLADKLGAAFTVYDMNFSGHGGTQFQDTFTINQFAVELEQFIESKKLQGIHIFGYSMGGYVALSLASRSPQLIDKIFTFGTKFNWTPATAEKEVKMLNPVKIEEKVPAFAKALADRHAPNDWKEVLYKTKDMMLELGDKPLLTPAALSKISNQVVIGIGDQDNMVSIDESETVANQLANGEIKVFEGFKHPIEQADIEILVDDLTHYIKK